MPNVEHTPTSVMKIGKTIKVLLIVILATQIGLFGFESVQLWINPEAMLDLGSSESDFAVGLSLLLFLLVFSLSFFSCGILVMIWVYISYKNTIAFNQHVVATTPGWTPVHWIIPFGSLFLPYRTFKEIYLGTSPSSKPAAFGSEDTVPSKFGVWWGLWILINCVGWLSDGVFGAATLEEAQFYNYIELVYSLLLLACGGLFYTIIEELSNRQEHLVSKINNGPPSPTLYFGN